MDAALGSLGQEEKLAPHKCQPVPEMLPSEPEGLRVVQRTKETRWRAHHSPFQSLWSHRSSSALTGLFLGLEPRP